MPFIYPYISSYFKQWDPTVSSTSNSKLATFLCVFEAFFMCLAMVLYSHIGIRTTYLLIIANQLGFNLIASACTSLPLFCLFFSLGNCFATGGFMYLSLYCLWRYFEPKHRGLLSGLVMSSYAIYPMVSSTISFCIVNPENVAPHEGTDYFPEEVAERFPHFVRMLAVFYCVTGILGLAIIVEPFENVKTSNEIEATNFTDLNLSQKNDQLLDTAEQLQASKQKEDKGLTWQDIRACFQDQLFTQIVLLKVLTFVGVHFFMFSYKRIGLLYLPQADKALTIIGNMASCSNAISRCAASEAWYTR
jgi:MFS family permease